MLKQLMAAAEIAMLFAQMQAIRQSEADKTVKHNAIIEILAKINEVYKANAES